jgi:hypothetical protein
MSKLTNEIIVAAIAGFEAQKQRIDTQISELRTMLSGGAVQTAKQPGEGRRKFSAETVQRMREAQRLRWAKVKGQSASKETSNVSKPKRKLSAAGRKAIADALRKRWAAKRAAEQA